VAYDGSAGGLGRHVARWHPEEAAQTKPAKKQKEDESSDEDLPSGAATADAARDLVAQDLDSFSCTSRKGLRTWLKKWGKAKVGKRHALTTAFDKLSQAGKRAVAEKLARAKKANCKFALSADSWKTKGKKRRHFHAVFVHWVDEHWKHLTVCAGAVELERPRNHKKYATKTEELVTNTGLELKDFVAAVTDHDGSIRKGMKHLGLPLVGCGCHLVQLPLRHVLPPVRPDKKKEAAAAAAAAARAEDSSSSSSSDETGSDTEESDSEEADGASAAAAPAAPAPKAKPKKRPRDEERAELTAALTPLFTKVRKLAKHYWCKEDSYNQLEKTAKDQSLPFHRFQAETAVRWNSSLAHLQSHLYNDAALAVHQKQDSSVPEKLEGDELKDVQQLCGLLLPFKVATKVLERDPAQALGSHAVPCVLGAVSALAEDKLVPLPDEAGTFGSGASKKKYFAAGDLRPLPARLRNWLRKDLLASFNKHNRTKAGKPTKGLEVLLLASYFDPRHKQLKFLSPEERTEVKRLAQVWAVQELEGVPHNDPEAEAQPDEKEALDNLSLAALGRGGRGGRGRGGGASAKAKAKAQAKVKAKAKAAPVPADEKPFGEADLFQVPEEGTAEHALPCFATLKQELKKWDDRPPSAPSQDPLDFWKVYAGNAPLLALVVRRLWAVPGSSAGLERAFSHAGRCVNPKRARLSTRRAEALITTHENVIRGIF
jgi:hypothetical protein